MNIQQKTDRVAEYLEVNFPGTVAGDIGYTITTGQATTWNIPASLAVPAGIEAIHIENFTDIKSHTACVNYGVKLYVISKVV